MLNEAIDNVTADNWQKCIEHVIKQEQKMWDLDTRVEVLVEPLIINLGSESTDSNDSDQTSDNE